jgi:polyhydroxyalkanoate synthesis repressor PhaR
MRSEFRSSGKRATLAPHMRLTRQPPRLIKKYPNRRLYDTTDSAYITLDELVSRVKGGADVRIVDATTGEDLTQQTLAQMLFDGRGAARFLSTPLLLQLVRLGDDALADFLGRYVATALEFYLQSRRTAQAFAPFNPFATLPFAATESLARLLNGALPWPGGAQAYAPSPYAIAQGAAAPPPSQPFAATSSSGAVMVPAVPVGHEQSQDEAIESVVNETEEHARSIDALREELAALRARVQSAETAALVARAPLPAREDRATQKSDPPSKKRKSPASKRR